MTDREVLFMTYGALKATMPPKHDVIQRIEQHLYPETTVITGSPAPTISVPVKKVSRRPYQSDDEEEDDA